MPISDLFPETIANASGDDASPSKEYLVDYYRKIGKWCDSAYEEGAASQKDIPEIQAIQESLDYLMGQQWKEPLPSYRAKPVSNEIMTMFWETVGLCTDVKPMFHIKDIGGEGGYSKTADILNKLARGWAGTRRFERSLAFATIFGMFTSAPAKIYWDPFANGHSGDPGDGDISFEALPQKSLLRLGENEYDIQQDECVIYRKVRTLEWIVRMFPKMGPMVKAESGKSRYTVDTQAPVDVMPQLFQELSPAGKRLMGASEKNSVESVYPRAEVREFWRKDSTVNESRNRIWMGPRTQAWGYWVEPGKMLYPRGRLIIRANGVTLYDEPNPYFHRKFPFELLGLYAVPWQHNALSVVAPWQKQNDILNQIMAGVLQTVKKATNPALMADKKAINPEAMRAIDASKPGLKVTYNGMGGAAPIWAQPPNIPAYVFNAYNIVQQSMKATSGMSAMDQAAGKKQIPGSDTLDRMTFSKSTPIRLMGRNIEDFVNEIGGQWTADALQFYDAARRIELLGKEGLVPEDVDDKPGSLIPDGIQSEAYVRRFHFKCDKGTLLNVQRQDRIQIMFALRKNHDISRKELFRALDLNINVEQNDQELMEEMKSQAQAMAAAGVQPGKKNHK